MQKELVKRGAEAVLYKMEYAGQPALLKERIPKHYRLSVLDEHIRKQRTKQEAVLLHRAKEAGVRAPFLLRMDKKKNQLWMEWIAGKQLKALLSKSNLHWCTKAGKQVARLHNAGIIHGDLTTSNLLVREKELVFIDFGLGFFSDKVEDMAVDLVNFKKTFQATHFNFSHGFDWVLKAYRQSYSNASAVLRQMEKVEQRIRYA